MTKKMLGKVQGWIGKALYRWRLLWNLDAGHRFQTRYHSRRLHRERGKTSSYGRIFNLVGGPVLIAAGFAFLPTPGPSYIIVVIGSWMLAGEFLPLARLFDRIEVRLRKLGRWIKTSWFRASTLEKVLVVPVIVACVAALGHLLIA
jgi:hypothetical protein